MLAIAPLRQLALARRVGSCSLTIKRRVDRLVGQGMVEVSNSLFMVTTTGRSALGDVSPRTPWVNWETISAATARDVCRRLEHPNDDRSAVFRYKIASLGAQAGMATTRLKRSRFNVWIDRMAG